MSDRFGPSIDCPKCGQSCNHNDLIKCPINNENMCLYCLENHDHTIYSNDQSSED
ncbi:MAG: hypothetical protein ACW972_03525 [Promethearchaeota archaeon]|jgi:hypothetical protein